LLGAGEAPLAVMAAFSAAHGLLQHSNIDLRTGVLDRVLSTARVHRWHHSPRRVEADANYCPRLLLWDHLFGTYRFDPNEAPPENVGLGPDDATFPEGFVDQMLIPFRRAFWERRP
jgi:sterol desaturase/sphingolipid hydroxylase (fatty acid hydroxylase superfamily)